MTQNIAPLVLTLALAGTLVACNPNDAPMADAGDDQAVDAGDEVTLSGEASADPDEDPITYAWTLTVPEGSTATLSDPTTAVTTFTADVGGTYVAELVVSDEELDSAPDAVSVVANGGPIADAGIDQGAITGEPISLSGAASSDPEGDPLTYAWSFSSVPAGSAAALSDVTAVDPSFTPDVFGFYEVDLVVSDGTLSSDPDTVSVLANSRPMADAGTDQYVALGSLVQLDGSLSADPEGGALSYGWTFSAVPADSAITEADFSDAGVVSPTFTPDVPGAYTVVLAVSDGVLGASDEVTVQVDEYVVLTQGLTVSLYTLDAGALVEVDSASLPDDPHYDQNQLFSLIQYPGTSTFYATTLNGPGDDAWWGDAELHRFVITPDGVEYDGMAFAYDPDSYTSAEIARCASDSWSEAQVGSCAPVNGVFSADGTRLYVNDDSDDTLHIFEVDVLGDLTLLWEGGNLAMHGVALHPTEPYLYNGGNVVELDGDQGTNLDFSWSSAGNFTTLADPDLLFTTHSTSAMAVYSLTDPASPTLVDEHTTSGNLLRGFALDLAHDRVVTVGKDNVTSFDFDGSTLTQLDQLVPSGDALFQARAVALNAAGDVAAVAWFSSSEEYAYDFTGGYSLFGVDGDGVLSELESMDFEGSARYVTMLRLP